MIRLSNEKARNAFSSHMADTIIKSANLTSSPESDVRALIITGTESSFCSGRDLKASLGHTPEEATEYLGKAQSAVKALLNCPVPIVVSMEKICLGLGLELALAGDIRIAGRSTELGFPEINLGLFPGCGGAVLLPALLNVSIAMDWIFTGRRILTQEGKQVGLLHRVVEDGEAFSAGLELGRTLASKNRSLLIKAKSVVRGHKASQDQAWMDLSEKYRAEVAQHSEHKEALIRFSSRKNGN